jgi:hypothetical protein
MKLTDIDLSSLADVTDAIFLLEAWRANVTDFAALPTIKPELVVNPAPAPNLTAVIASLPATSDITHMGEVVLTQAERKLDFGFPVADAEKLRGLGVDPVTAQPIATNGDPEKLRALGLDPFTATSLDAASVFGGATAQSAAPLQLVHSTAGVAASPTVPAALPGSGALPALQALAQLPVASAAAPAAPAPQASPAGGVELDADGLPWHESIHAGTKRKNADGRWTAKRGINDPDLVPRVQAQLRAQMAAGGVTTLTQLQANIPQPTTAPAPQVTAAPVDALQALAGMVSPAVTLAQEHAALMRANVVPPAQVQSAAPFVAPAALAPIGAAPGAKPSTSPSDTLPGAKPVPLTFQDFMTAMTVEVMSGRVPATVLLEACKPHGGTTALAANPAPIPEIWAALKAQYPGML